MIEARASSLAVTRPASTNLALRLEAFFRLALSAATTAASEALQIRVALIQAASTTARRALVVLETIALSDLAVAVSC